MKKLTNFILACTIFLNAMHNQPSSNQPIPPSTHYTIERSFVKSNKNVWELVTVRTESGLQKVTIIRETTSRVDVQQFLKACVMCGAFAIACALIGAAFTTPDAEYIHFI